MFHSQARQTATGENPVKSSGAPPQVPVVSQAAASDACSSAVWDIITHDTRLSPPTTAVLHDLMAVPQGMFKAMQSSRSGGKKGSARAKLAREGQIVSKLFNPVASRPQPRNGVTLEQSIQLEMSFTLRDVILSSATAGIYTFASYQVSVGAFSGATSLLSVFDQYRIDQVEVWLETPNVNGGGVLPMLFSAVDLDDSNTPTTIGNVQDKQGAIVAGGGAGHYHKWKPHVAVAVYSGAFTSFANEPAGWIDAASPNVQHYGLKFATLSSGPVVGFNLTVRGVLSFRSPAIN